LTGTFKLYNYIVVGNVEYSNCAHTAQPRMETAVLDVTEEGVKLH